MATVESIISDACDLMNRPDLAATMRRRCPALLERLHASSDFKRDLRTTAAEVPTASPHSLAVPSGFRKLAGFDLRDASGVQISVRFKPREVQPYSSYWGYVGLDYTYLLAGGACTVELPALPATIAMSYWSLPVTTTVDGLLSSDSWIATYWPDVLLYALIDALAPVVEHKGWMARASLDYRNAWIAMAAVEQQTPEHLV